MSEPSTLAEFIATENAKEAGLSAPHVPAVVESTASAESAAEASAADPAPETTAKPPSEPDADTPAVEAAPTDDRNPDGTFKKRDKVTNTGEWARNKRLTAELREAQAQLARLSAGGASPAPAASAPAAPSAPDFLDPRDPPPSVEQFLNTADPYQALALEAAKWAVREDRRHQQAQQQQTALQQTQQALAEREAKFIADHPDYTERVNDWVGQHDWHPSVLHAIAEDEQGPAVAYYLADHPDEVQRLALLTPVAAVREIGKLFGRLSAAPVGSAEKAVVITSKAKPLIKPVSAAPMAPDHSPPDPEKVSLSEFMRYHNAEERKRREVMRGA